MDLRTPQPEESVEPPQEPSRPAPVKYLYPTGSTPLEGYTLKRGVGRGGFGEVYFATSDAGKEVALKLIRRNLDVELRGVKHCLNLKHTNLISIYDIRTDSVGDQWVVMEYVSGESLEQVIERHPNGMPKELVLKWMRGVGAGVAYLHDHGIVHRDLKPGNVFLDDDFRDASDGGTVKIGDYGLSKFISCSQRSGQTESVGTVHYMAPEIANGRYGREIDTYALGIILYEMVTGHVPFEGESIGEVLMKHLTAEPNLDRLEEPYREIVRRTLAKDPEVRIGSVNEMLALLPDGPSAGPLPDLNPNANRDKVGENGWTNAEASSDGIGGDRLFPDTSVRGLPPNKAGNRTGSPQKVATGHQEPLYEAISENWSRLVDNWHDWQAPSVLKSIVLFIMVALVVVSLPLWGAEAMGFGVLYLFYFVFWSIFVRPSSIRNAARHATKMTEHRATRQTDYSPPPASGISTSDVQLAPAPPVRPTRREQADLRQRLRTNWREEANKKLAAKPLREKTTELLSAMVLSALLCTFLSLLAVFVISGVSGKSYAFPLHLWFSIVTSVSCWVILAVNKFSEGRFEDQMPARVLMMIAGAALGLLSFSVSEQLLISVPFDRNMSIGIHESMLAGIYRQNGSLNTPFSRDGVVITGLISVLYFALLFAMLRWWRLAEYTRRTRMSLVSVGLCICGAWIASLVCWYPQPTGLAIAGVVAVATQLVSPWLPPSERKSTAENSVAA